MDFNYAEDDEHFRQELREFLDTHHPGRAGRGAGLEHARAWAATRAGDTMSS